MQRHHDPSAFRPTGTCSGGKRNDGDFAPVNCDRATSTKIRKFRRRIVLAMVRMVANKANVIENVVSFHLLNHCAGRQSVLRKADAAFLQVGADLLVLRAIEPMFVQQRGEGRAGGGLGFAAREQRVEERLHDPAQLGPGPAGCPKFVQLGAAQRRERAQLLPQQRRDGERVVALWHQRVGVGEQIGEGTVFVDGKIINHRLHREGQRVLQLALRSRHDFLQALLCGGLLFRRENESHAAARHAAEHPEAPEVFPEPGGHTLDERLGVIAGGPGNNGLNRPAKIARGGRADGADIAFLQCGKNFVEYAEGLLAAAPLGFGAEQVFLGDHFEDRAHILRHTAVHEHEAFLQFATRLRRGVALLEDTVQWHESATTDAEFGIAFAG